MTYRLNIIVVAGLVINLIAGLANAANQNPWAMYGGKRGGNTGGVNSSGFAAVPNPQQSQQQRVAPKKLGYEYAPLGKNQDPANSRNRQSNGQFQGQPYGQGYGFQPFGQGGFGGQFGFGMNFAPNFSQGFPQGFGGTGMPFGFGVPTMPFFGGSNNYGTPYRGVPGFQNVNPYGNPYGNPYANPYGYPRVGFSPWGMGFPMF